MKLYTTFIATLTFLLFCNLATAQTRLLRQPDISNKNIAFTYGSDVWVTDRNGQNLMRITSTPAVEKDPHFSPDGSSIAFVSNRSGTEAVYVVALIGGEAKRLSWKASEYRVRGWTPDGNNILYSSPVDATPNSYSRLFTVPAVGGPAKLVSEQWGFDGSFAGNGIDLAIDKMDRWDVEFRGYRGGQNSPLILLNKDSQQETFIPFTNSIDIQPLWIGASVYFLSDRNTGVSNLWQYQVAEKKLTQLTFLEGSDIKCLNGIDNTLVFERDGNIYLFDLEKKETTPVHINIVGDFPWAEAQWEDLTGSMKNGSLSPTGKRVIVEARGEIFTLPVENGNVRNLSQSSESADRNPFWFPNGEEVGWFSDKGGNGYVLQIAEQDGLKLTKTISLGESKLAWQPTISPDGKLLAFNDHKAIVRVMEIATGKIITVDTGGTNLDRGNMDLSWSHDSKWLAYVRTAENHFRQIRVYSAESGQILPLTNVFADAFNPVWDRNNKNLYLLASTNIGLGSGWANTSSQQANPSYDVYVVNLKASDTSPFKPKSDEEVTTSEETATPIAPKIPVKKPAADQKSTPNAKASSANTVAIDFENIDRRMMAIDLPSSHYINLLPGPAGVLFVAEETSEKGNSIKKYTLSQNEAKDFEKGNLVAVSNNGNSLLISNGPIWKVAKAGSPNGNDAVVIAQKLMMNLDRKQEWNQIFEEAWRYERDYFYDRNMHGRDWNEVYRRYAPLVPHIRHRADLTYILDQMNGELSVGHSFVFGGDFPKVPISNGGLLGIDFTPAKDGWKIGRIYTTETWNPGQSSPLDKPGLQAKTGNYIVAINGKPLLPNMDPYQLLDGTNGIQTLVHINDKAGMEGAWSETVVPIKSETGIRTRAWVEDNRRKVDSLSGGKLGYVWVPNTGGNGFISFNRYFFAQQNKLGAVIDERFNGGGLLDDYMVDLMTRVPRAAVTNEVPNGKHFVLPAGILGPKVLLINELAGSGGDFFPWAFRHQKAGLLVGATTWGGLVKSSVHYQLVDGGALTAPDNAVFDPENNQWIAENTGIAPDVFVRQDAKSLHNGRDPQLEKAVEIVLDALKKHPVKPIVAPNYPTPAKTKQ